VGSHIILHTDTQSITGFRCRITNHCASAHSMAYSEPHRTPQSRTEHLRLFLLPEWGVL
jgi:hypothetical protein